MTRSHAEYDDYWFATSVAPRASKMATPLKVASLTSRRRLCYRRTRHIAPPAARLRAALKKWTTGATMAATGAP